MTPAAYAVGVLVTMLAAYLPARRAGTVPPIAAMQENAVLPGSSMKLRMLGGGLLGIAGAGCAVA